MSAREEAFLMGYPCCEHCLSMFCTEDEPPHGEPCEEPGCEAGPVEAELAAGERP